MKNLLINENDRYEQVVLSITKEEAKAIHNLLNEEDDDMTTYKRVQAKLFLNLTATGNQIFDYGKMKINLTGDDAINIEMNGVEYFIDDSCGDHNVTAFTDLNNDEILFRYFDGEFELGETKTK